MIPAQSESIWVLVYVRRGIPATVEAFYDGAEAQERENVIRQNINVNDDETGLFHININHHTTDNDILENKFL